MRSKPETPEGPPPRLDPSKLYRLACTNKWTGLRAYGARRVTAKRARELFSRWRTEYPAERWEIEEEEEGSGGVAAP